MIAAIAYARVSSRKKKGILDYQRKEAKKMLAITFSDR
jgi:predicted site-specific integrase-resolvase